MKFLSKKGIETKVRHPILMPDQPVYQNRKKDNLINSKMIIREILSLPANEKITKDDMDYVGSCIREFYNEKT